MSKAKSRKKRPPKRVLALPDLEHAKTAVLNSLTSASGQRTYEHDGAACAAPSCWPCASSQFRDAKSTE